MHVILFDIDGTLVDSNDFDSRLYVRAIRTVLGMEIGSDWSLYENVTDSGIVEEILDRMTPMNDRARLRAEIEETFVALVASHLADCGGRLLEVPGAKAFVDRLAAHPEVSLAVATGGWRRTALMKLRGIGLEPEALRVVTASEAKRRVDIMQLAEAWALAGRPADRTTYFGDAPWDMQASAALGYDFVAIGERVECPMRYRDFRRAEAILSALGLSS